MGTTSSVFGKGGIAMRNADDYIDTPDGRKIRRDHLAPHGTHSQTFPRQPAPRETPKVVDKGSAYLFTWDTGEISIEVSQIREHKDGKVTCQILIETSADNYDPHLLQSSFNLSSLRSRQELKKELQKRYDKEAVNWEGMLEQVCVHTLKEFKAGERAVEIWAGLPDKEIPKPEYLIEPILYKNKPTLFFGEGKAGKSYLALTFALLVQLPYEDNRLELKPTRANTLLLDYETDQEDTEYRLNMLVNGFDLPAVSIWYRRCTMPLIEDIANIQGIVKENKIDFVIVDSLGVAASGGNLNESQTATQFFAALRKLNVTSLLITHTSKEGNGAKTPFGSVYFGNLARSIFEVKKQQEIGEDSLSIALFHRNNNLGKLISPLGYRLVFGGDSVRVTKQDVSDIPEFSSELPLHISIQQVLKSGPLSVKEIAEELGANEDSVGRTLRRHKGKYFIKVDSQWGLLAKL